MRRIIPLFGILAVLTACVPSQPSDVSSAYLGEDVVYRDNADFTGYLAVPEGEGPFPSVILIHEWWGLNDQIKEMADRFAKEGYIALAVDLYEGKSTTEPDQARALATGVRENQDAAFANLQSAVDFLQAHPLADSSHMASVGWCFGGGWSYQMAKNNLGVSSSVIYYGQFNPEDDLEQMRTVIQGHFGEDDTGIPVDDVKAFRAKLQTQNGQHEIFIYENAGHAFANEGGDRYHEESARKAWERTLEFLGEQLKSDSAPKEKSVKEETDAYIIEVTYPVLGQEKADMELQSVADEQIAWFKDLIKDFDPPVAEGAKQSLYMWHETTQFSDNIRSVLFRVSFYTGGAHPNHFHITRTFDMRTGDALFLDDLFSTQDYLPGLTQQVRSVLSQTLQDSEWISSGTDAAEPDNFAAWTLDASDLTFYFDPYQVAAYAAGSQEVSIALTDIKNILSPLVISRP